MVDFVLCPDLNVQFFIVYKFRLAKYFYLSTPAQLYPIERQLQHLKWKNYFIQKISNCYISIKDVQLDYLFKRIIIYLSKDQDNAFQQANIFSKTLGKKAINSKWSTMKLICILDARQMMV